MWYEFTDSSGARVQLPAAPQRVAVLFSSFADIWVTAGGKVSITVGESVERGFADSSAVLVDDGAGKKIDTEALIAANPDFVLYSADIPAQAACATLLMQAGIPCAQFRVESFSDYLTLLKICTDITGRTDAYETHGTALALQINTFLANKPFNGKRILFVRAGSSARSVKAKNSADNFACAMLAELGAENIADTAPALLDELSVEAILQSDPDHIFFTSMGDEAAAQAYVREMLTEDTWASLRAVKNNNVTFLPKTLFHYKPNARWAEAYDYLIERTE